MKVHQFGGRETPTPQNHSNWFIAEKNKSILFLIFPTCERERPSSPPLLHLLHKMFKELPDLLGYK